MPLRASRTASSPSRSNGRNSRSSWSDAIPGPSSRTSIRTRSPSPSPEVTSSTAPRGATVPDRVAHQVDQHLQEATRVRSHLLVADPGRQPHALLVGQRSEQLGHLVDRVAHVDHLREQRQHTGVQPGQVLGVVDEREQVGGRAVDVVERLGPSGAVEVEGAEQLGEPGDRLQRRAHLVADPGEEVRRGAGVLLGGAARHLRLQPGAAFQLQPGVLHRHRRQVGEAVDQPSLPLARPVRVRVVDGEGAHDLRRPAEDGRRPARPHPGAADEVAERLPPLVGVDVLGDHADAGPGRGAARPGGGADPLPVDRREVRRRQARCRPVPQRAAVVVEQQDRAAAAGDQPLQDRT